MIPRSFFYFVGDRLWIRPDGPRTQAIFPAPAALPPVWEPVADGLAVAASPSAPAPGAALLPLRALFDRVDGETFARAGTARQLLNWRETFRFCSVCGKPLVRHATEHAMHCPACGQLFYPRLNPVVIVAVSRDHRLLLTHKAQNLYPFWSIVAGFVEPNETLEEAVRRELHEEVGIQIKNLRYLKSQAWPFPNNLMLGFSAEYAGGELKPDGIELDAADWFAANQLPPLPGPVSIGRYLIDQFFKSQN